MKIYGIWREIREKHIICSEIELSEEYSTMHMHTEKNLK